MTQTSKQYHIAVYDRIPCSNMNIARFYDEVLQKHSNWSLVGFYVDRGKSGIHAENRDALNRMISDIRHWKIDLIITRSIACFTRNRVDFARLTSIIHRFDVDIFFISENMLYSEMRSEDMAKLGQWLSD